MDTDGRLLFINLTAAGHLRLRRPPDDPRQSAQALAQAQHLFADGAYDCTKLKDMTAFLDFTVEIVRRSDAAQGFGGLPRRWVASRFPSPDAPPSTAASDG